MYARGLVVRRNSSFAVLSPMPPVPPTNTVTRPVKYLPCALDLRMVSMLTISRFAPNSSFELMSDGEGMLEERPEASTPGRASVISVAENSHRLRRITRTVFVSRREATCPWRSGAWECLI